MKPNPLLQLARFLWLAHGPERPARLSPAYETPGDRDRRLRVALASRRRGNTPLKWADHPLWKGQNTHG